jgi:hypothetical protein
MAPLGRSPFALRVCAAAALLSGCGGGSQLGANPVQQNLALIDRGAVARAAPDRSWIAPEAKKSDLAYISNFYNSTILAFTYPGGKLVGTLTVPDPQGECVSTSTGDWWVSANDEMLEYSHGGATPIKTLSGVSGSCAIDPTTGDLAVLSSDGIIIYPRGSGSGTAYCTGEASGYFDGYDNKGNLFVDGIIAGDTYGLLELPKGSSTCETITLSQSLEYPGGIQWYGKYLAVGDQEAHVIYHFAIHGTSAKEIGTTELGGSSDVVEFYIQKPYVVGADAGNNDAEMWKYPAGGPIFKTLKGNGSFDLPIGATVSVAR